MSTTHPPQRPLICRLRNINIARGAGPASGYPMQEAHSFAVLATVRAVAGMVAEGLKSKGLSAAELMPCAVRPCPSSILTAAPAAGAASRPARRMCCGWRRKGPMAWETSERCCMTSPAARGVRSAWWCVRSRRSGWCGAGTAAGSDCWRQQRKPLLHQETPPSSSAHGPSQEAIAPFSDTTRKYAPTLKFLTLSSLLPTCRLFTQMPLSPP